METDMWVIQTPDKRFYLNITSRFTAFDVEAPFQKEKMTHFIFTGEEKDAFYIRLKHFGLKTSCLVDTSLCVAHQVYFNVNDTMVFVE